MEATRLVFVSVRNAKPRRKVAIPIPNGYTWDQFCQQISTKLRLKGVQKLELATSGEHITNLDELQDIDELYVEEALMAQPQPIANGHHPDRSAAGPSNTAVPANFLASPSEAGPTSRSQKVNVPSSDANTSPMNTESEQKYAKRGGVKRSLQKVLPGFFSPTLPVTTRDIQDDGKGGRRRRRRQRNIFSLRNILKSMAALIFILFLLFLYTLMVPRLE